QLKNEIHGVLLDNGVRDRALGTRLANSPARAEELLKTVELSAASRVCILTSLALLASLQDQKETLKREIYQAGRPLEAEVKLLISIRGVTPLLALAFLSEVGDITRFASARRLHSYLGVVPTMRSSGGDTQRGDQPTQPGTYPQPLHAGGDPPGGLLSRAGSLLPRVGWP
ncbi:MAG: transposase, partial [Spirochaetia bacterium]